MILSAYHVDHHTAVRWWKDGDLTDPQLIRTTGTALFIHHLDGKRALFELYHMARHSPPTAIVWRPSIVATLLIRRAVLHRVREYPHAEEFRAIVTAAEWPRLTPCTP